MSDRAPRESTTTAGARRHAQKRSGVSRPLQNFSTLAGSPVSVYAPISLPHPLELFGKHFPVHISTHFTFNPDTVSRAAVGVSLDAGMRKFSPAHHQLIRTIVRIAAGKHKPSETTKRLVSKHYEALVASGVLKQVPDGTELPQEPWSAWDAVFKGLKCSDDEFLKQLCQVLAACDAHALYMRELTMRGHPEQAIASVDALFRPDLEAWVRLNPSLAVKLYVPIEVALKAIAWAECWGGHQPQAGPDPQTSCLDALLLPIRRPMGHWLAEVCAASGCRNLRQLETKLRWKVEHHGRPITHDLLRKWSSCTKVVIPAAAMPKLIAAVRGKNWVDTLPNRFYVARFLSFLCDLLRAGTEGQRPAWEDVQAQVRSRYAQAYRLQVAQLTAARSSMSPAP